MSVQHAVLDPSLRCQRDTSLAQPAGAERSTASGADLLQMALGPEAARDLGAVSRPADAARSSGSSLCLVAESASQKIFTTRPDGAANYLNAPWSEFTGMPVEHMLGWGWMQFIHADDLSETVRRWRHSVDAVEPFEFEHRIRRADGNYRWHTTRAFALRDGERDVALWIGWSMDIDDQKVARADLEEEHRAHDEVLAVLGHELRNFLAPISNALELMRLADPQPRPEVLNAQGMIDRHVQSLERLVDDLLDVSRIGAGKIVLRKQHLDLSQVVRHAVESSRSIMEAGNHPLEVILPEEALDVDVDAMRLGQVVLNLLNNAAKYTPEGGRIRLAAAREHGQATIRVRDSGVGIPADMLSKVFDLFVQEPRSLDRAQAGLGLGLHLVRLFTEMHGGAVEARSAGVGHGTEFIVRLPLSMHRQEFDVPRPRGQTECSPTVAHDILVVDDARDAAYVLGELLRALGQRVRVSRDGPSALAALGERKPDLVFSDISMPGMDGYELAERILAMPGFENVTLVALTGYAQENDKLRGREAGFRDYLAKPVSLQALRQLLASLPASRNP